MDPARDGLNWYVYCENNPVKYVDPDGCAEVIALAILWADAVVRDPGTQIDIQMAALNFAEGNYLAGIIDLAGVALPGITAAGKPVASKIDDIWRSVKGFFLRNSDEIIDAGRAASSIDEIGDVVRPLQKHHFLTNKHSKYTVRFKDVVAKYGLDLDGKWNVAFMKHAGRHPHAYHEYMLEEVKNIHTIAQGDTKKFLELFEQVKWKIMNNPEMLTKGYWQ
jgi:hypothetical protein